jgi:SWI/SNF-related matrix-associated actin-dependent regulator 1 of chromatin subfamily A
MIINGIKKELYEYQKIGIKFLVDSGGRALLADSPGVGKTAQALGYVSHSGHNRTLVVCPASVKFCWEDEVEKWTNLTSFVVDSKTNLSDIPHDVNLVIINFEILKKFFNEFMKYKWDCLVVDESHLIKSPTAIRSKVIKALSKVIPNVIMLTGTPVLSRPIEMFNMLSILDPQTWNNYYHYAVKYCEGKQGYWGFEAKGASNLEELKGRISRYFLRRTKEEVLSELPTKNPPIYVPIKLPDEARKQYDLVEANLIKYLKEYKKDKTDKEIAKSLQAEKLVKLNLLREINAIGKIPTAREMIDNIIEAGQKVIVFSSFNAPLKELEEMYEENSVLLLGDTPVDERGALVKKFQEDPNINVFFGGTRSAGVGITLTAASNVIFLDLPWNPADLDQGENRAHRPGAVYDSLNIYRIVGKDTIDGFMRKLIERKQEIIDQLIEGGEKVEEDHSMVDDYIKELEAKYKK